MSKFNHYSSNFSNGEISPRTMGRVDLDNYKQACELQENWITLKSGGLTRCPGTQHVASLTLQGKSAVLPFIRSKQEAYVVSLDPSRGGGAQPFVRIFRTDGTEATVGENPYFLFAGVVFGPLQIGLDPRGFDYTQIADALFVTHRDGTFLPMVITRTDNNDFSVHAYLFNNPYNPKADVNIILHWPFRDVNVSAMTLTPSVTTGTGKMSSSAAFFNAGHAGAIIKLTHAGTTGAARITGFLSTTNVNITVLSNFGATTATTNWEESSWSDYRGWPKTVTAFEQRLIWGGNDAEPDTLWGSLLGNVFHMMGRRFAQDIASGANTSGLNYFIGSTVPDTSKSVLPSGLVVLPTDPFTLTLASNEVNAIAWVSGSKVLNMGTLGQEFIGSGSSEEVFGATSPGIQAQTSFGSTPMRPARVNDEVIFVGRDGREVRNFKFNDNNGSNISEDLTQLADHVAGLGGDQRGFTFCTYQASRSMVWFINENNYLLGLTYNPRGGVVAWMRRPVAGMDVKVWGAAAVPNSSGNFDDLYLAVERELAGGVLFTIEKIGQDFDEDTVNSFWTEEFQVPIYVDAAVTHAFIGVESSIPGLTHLEGESVLVTKNGVLLGTFVVAAGAVDLGATHASGSKFVVGLKAPADCIPTEIEAGGDWGVSQGMIQRPDKAVLLVHNTYDLQVGEPGGTMEQLQFEGHTATDVFSGDALIHLPHGPKRRCKLRFYAYGPYPATILSVATRGVSYD